MPSALTLARRRSISATIFESKPGPSVRRRAMSHAALHQKLFDFTDGPRGVEALRAGVRAVHDRVTAIEAERILEIVEPLAGVLVARIDHPAIGLQQRRRPQIALRIPPIARARGRAAGAEDALVKPIELGAV